MFAQYGIHELQNAPNALLVALNPMVHVHAGSYENADAIERNQARARELVALLPNTLIGMRWWPDDNILLKERDRYFNEILKWGMPPFWWRDPKLLRAVGETYANRFFPLHVPGTVLMVGNEDANSKRDTLIYEETVALHTIVCEIGTERQVPCALCCTSMGTPEYGQYELLAPLFAEM